MTDITALHDELRPLMFSVAYGMLGSVAEAEDITQEAMLRMYREAEPIRSPSAYAVTVTTRLAIDQLRSARVRREVYVGSWLPEPLVTSGSDGGPDGHMETVERLSVAFLVLLERLSPVERAVLLLREVFDYDYERIAEIVEKSEVNCRQILGRAKAHLHQAQPRFTASAAHRDALAQRFLDACQRGDLAALERVLAEDIQLTGDGGGKAAAVPAPIMGRTRVARFLVGLFRQARALGVTVLPTRVNGAPGLLATRADGGPLAVVSLEIADQEIVAVYSIVNPDKLRHLAR